MKVGQAELLKMLIRKECPFCEGYKLDGCMFCDKCYDKLPGWLKAKIKNALRGLGESLRAGINFLEG